MKHSDKARDLFLEGYNCAQSVFAAFCDVTGIEEKEALRMSSAFGGGMGGARETCGAVSAGVLILGIIEGYDDPSDISIKKAHYARVKEMIDRFIEKNGTVVCRELLNGLEIKSTPSERTAEYYKTRPCVRFVEDMAEILDEMMKREAE